MYTGWVWGSKRASELTGVSISFKGTSPILRSLSILMTSSKLSISQTLQYHSDDDESMVKTWLKVGDSIQS